MYFLYQHAPSHPTDPRTGLRQSVPPSKFPVTECTARPLAMLLNCSLLNKTCVCVCVDDSDRRAFDWVVFTKHKQHTHARAPRTRTRIYGRDPPSLVDRILSNVKYCKKSKILRRCAGSERIRAITNSGNMSSADTTALLESVGVVGWRGEGGD